MSSLGLDPQQDLFLRQGRLQLIGFASWRLLVCLVQTPAQCFLKGEYGPHLSYFSSSSGLPQDKPISFILHHRMLLFSGQLWKVRTLLPLL